MAAILAAVVVGASERVSAQDTNAPAAPMKSKRFAGKISAVDSTAKTVTVDNKTDGSRTFGVTSDTKIMKDGKPGTLSDGVVGEPVRGTYTTGADGKMVAKMLSFGAPPMKKPTTTN